jgi:hypothetical protein
MYILDTYYVLRYRVSVAYQDELGSRLERQILKALDLPRPRAFAVFGKQLFLSAGVSVGLFMVYATGALSITNQSSNSLEPPGASRVRAVTW